MTPTLRLIRLPALVVLGCLALTGLAVAGSASAATPVLRAVRSCTPPTYPGAGYFTRSIRATNVTCRYAREFVVAHYRCRIRRGGADGRCPSVRRFRCTEARESIPTEINARVTCRRGTQKIVHTYQQNIE